jgi:hypothetical protein
VPSSIGSQEWQAAIDVTLGRSWTSKRRFDFINLLRAAFVARFYQPGNRLFLSALTTDFSGYHAGISVCFVKRVSARFFPAALIQGLSSSLFIL